MPILQCFRHGRPRYEPKPHTQFGHIFHFLTHGPKAKSYKISCELRNYHEKLLPKINRKIYITRYFTRKVEIL